MEFELCDSDQKKSVSRESNLILKNQLSIIKSKPQLSLIESKTVTKKLLIPITGITAEDKMRQWVGS